MIDKSDALKKIKIQTRKKDRKSMTAERRTKIVQGILDANINKEESLVIQSDMPEEIMGVKVDWDEMKATEARELDKIKINPEFEKPKESEDEGEEDEE